MAEPQQPLELTLNEVLRGVAPDALQQLCTDRDIRRLAPSVPDWKDAAAFLGLNEVDEKTIEEENKTSLRRRIAVLRKWREKRGKKATYERLAKAFYEMGNVSLAEDVGKILTRSEPDSSEEEADKTSQEKGRDVILQNLVGVFKLLGSFRALGLVYIIGGGKHTAMGGPHQINFVFLRQTSPKS